MELKELTRYLTNWISWSALKRLPLRIDLWCLWGCGGRSKTHRPCGMWTADYDLPFVLLFSTRKRMTCLQSVEKSAESLRSILKNGAGEGRFDASHKHHPVTEFIYINRLANRSYRSTVKTLPATLPEPWAVIQTVIQNRVLVDRCEPLPQLKLIATSVWKRDI